MSEAPVTQDLRLPPVPDLRPSLILAVIPLGISLATGETVLRLIAAQGQRSVRRATLRAEMNHALTDPFWHLEADLQNCLVANATTYSEVFELAAAFQRQQAQAQAALHSTGATFFDGKQTGEPEGFEETWVRILVPKTPSAS